MKLYIINFEKIIQPTIELFIIENLNLNKKKQQKL